LKIEYLIESDGGTGPMKSGNLSRVSRGKPVEERGGKVLNPEENSEDEV
jgi:hypothetical protein